MQLSSATIQKLKARAQCLEPVLRLGKGGLSEPFLKSVDEALCCHELIKVRFSDFKEEKKRLAPLLAEKTSSCLVTRVGNVAVLYRENPDPARRVIRLEKARSEGDVAPGGQD